MTEILINETLDVHVMCFTFSYRGKSELINGTMSGGIVGGALGIRGKQKPRINIPWCVINVEAIGSILIRRFGVT